MLLPTVVVAVLTGCGAGSGGGDAAASCAALVDYRDHQYMGTEALGLTRGEPLGTATLPPPCQDTGEGGDPGGPTSVTALAVRGVDPDIAITLETAEDDVLYINRDSDVTLPEIKRMIRD
ncbi:DUF6281 family protein [Streptomyces fructofermentans]|uniref:DUF6281 family protein n=1 Tax=Streptomyces fructofermentans TaxID=152141 RepID=UPI0033DB4486